MEAKLTEAMLDVAVLSSLTRTLGALCDKIPDSADQAEARILFDKLDAVFALVLRAQGLQLSKLRGMIDIDTATVNAMWVEVQAMALEVATAAIQFIRPQAGVGSLVQPQE